MNPSPSRFLLRWMPAAAYGGLIFLLSSRPVPEAVPHVPLLDKLLHLLLYAGLGWLCCRALAPSSSAATATENGRSGTAWRSVALSGLLSTIYGISDELHQMAIPTRSADPLDVLADLAGSLAGAMLYRKWRHGRHIRLTNALPYFRK